MSNPAYLDTLTKQLSSMQKRQELYEDRIIAGQGSEEHNLEMVRHYREETVKLRSALLAAHTIPEIQLGNPGPAPTIV